METTQIAVVVFALVLAAMATIGLIITYRIVRR